MDVDALKTFLAIERVKSFSAAADQLNRTQPAISRRIALLEEELGAPLFERASSGVVLSQAGRVLLPFAERALAAMKDAAEAVHALRSNDYGPVALAVVGTLASTNLTAVLKRFAQRFPNVRLTLSTATSAEVSELVRRGDAILGLRYFDDPSGDLSSEPLTQERLVVVCAGDHRLAGKRVGTLSALKAEAWFAFPEIPSRREITLPHIHALFMSRGWSKLEWTPVDSLTAQKRLVEAGFGLALLPESAIKEEQAIKTLAVIRVGDLDAANPVSTVVRRGGYLSAAAKSLLEIIRAEYSLQDQDSGRRNRTK